MSAEGSPGAIARLKSLLLLTSGLALLGQRVSLSYDEHRGLPTSRFGDTANFVTDVKAAAGAPPAP